MNLVHVIKREAVRALNLLLCISLCLPANISLANSYKVGYTYYTTGKFSSAKTALLQAIKKNPSAAEKAEIYKLLGIIDYTSGNKANAQKAFELSKSYNPKGRISPDIVLDESVIGFFNSIQPKGSKKNVARKQASSNKRAIKRPQQRSSSIAKQRAAQTAKQRAAQAAKQRAAQAAKQRAAQAAKQRTTQNAKLKAMQQAKERQIRQKAIAKQNAELARKKNVTYIHVSTPARSGSVLIDGIIAGQINTNIEADAGSFTIGVTADGYYPYKAKVNVKRSQMNKFVVKLKKKPTKAEIAAAKAKAKAKKLALLRAQKRKQQLAKQKALAKQNTRAKQRQALLLKQRKKQNKRRVNKSGSSGGMFAESEPVYQQPQMPMQQQMQYAPAPMPAYQQPMYPQPMYQQPMYQPMPAYPQAYAAPAPVTPVAPPVMADPYLSEPQTFDNFDSGSPRKKRRKKKRKKVETNYITAVIPFGVGQYAHDKPLLGTLFLAGQAAALGMWYMYNSEADDATTAANAEIAARTVEIEQSSADEAESLQADLDLYSANIATYIQEQRDISNYALYGFFGLWAAGVLEAMIGGPAKPKPFDDWSSTEGDGAIWKTVYNNNDLIDGFKLESNNYSNSYDWSVSPEINDHKPSLALRLKADF